MKLRFNTVLTAIEGEPLTETSVDGQGRAVLVMEGNKPKRMTAWTIARTVLMSDVRTDDNLGPRGQPEPISGDEKIERMDLALRILEANRKNEDAEITTKEAALLKTLCGKVYTSNAVYAFHRFIEGKDQCQPEAKSTESSEKVVPIGGTPASKSEGPAAPAAAAQ